MNLAKHWRQRAARYRLEGQRHTQSGALRFPPADDQDAAWQPYRFSGRGTVYSFSLVRQPPDGYDTGDPYLLALIKLEEGPMITAQITDCSIDEASIDMPVEMVTRKLTDLGPEGLIVYGYKFRPLPQL